MDVVAIARTIGTVLRDVVEGVVARCGHRDVDADAHGRR
jgi:hypothetical protein